MDSLKRGSKRQRSLRSTQSALPSPFPFTLTPLRESQSE